MPKNFYSLQNKIYPLISLENEMERLFGTPVWHEEKIKAAKPDAAGSSKAENSGETSTQSQTNNNETDNAATNTTQIPNATSPDRIAFPETYRKVRSRPSKKQVCKFCLKNKEPENVYQSHVLKDANGVVVCPILRAYKCELCGASGDTAHTKKYCKLYEEMEVDFIA